MYEVELKVPADHQAIGRRLDALNAEHQRRLHQSDTYYDVPMRDFAATDEALRLRRVETDGETADDGEPRYHLTYKGPKVEEASKTRREVEVEVEDGDAMEAILDALDIVPVATVTKRRDRYFLDGFVISLDAVEGLGKFLEIETTVPTREEVPSARTAAVTLLERIGVDPSARINRSYLELLLDR